MRWGARRISAGFQEDPTTDSCKSHGEKGPKALRCPGLPTGAARGVGGAPVSVHESQVSRARQRAKDCL